VNPLDEIRRCHEDGRPAPGLAYRDPEVFEAEVATLFRDSWISVACGQNAPRSGDLFPVRIVGRSLLVVRDGEGGIRVFDSLCRHRGSSLADLPCRAQGGRIVCPYHAWGYDLDGRLVSAPHFHRREGTDQPLASERAELGLIPVRSAVWRDVVFVNLSGDAPAFEDFIRPIEERLSRWTAAELWPLCSDEYEIQANWKLAAENFLDVYHLPVVHPQLGGGFGGALTSEDVEVCDHVIGVTMPDGYGEDPGQVESPLPRFSGLGPGDRVRIEVFAVFPNTLILVEPEFQQVIVLRPQGPGVTQETFANYLATEASASEDLAKEREESARSSVEVNDQDAALLTSLQRTRSMDVGGDTQLSQAWDQTVRRFQGMWARKLLARP